MKRQKGDGKPVIIGVRRWGPNSVLVNTNVSYFVPSGRPPHVETCEQDRAIGNSFELSNPRWRGSALLWDVIGLHGAHPNEVAHFTVAFVCHWIDRDAILEAALNVKRLHMWYLSVFREATGFEEVGTRMLPSLQDLITGVAERPGVVSKRKCIFMRRSHGSYLFKFGQGDDVLRDDIVYNMLSFENDHPS